MLPVALAVALSLAAPVPIEKEDSPKPRAKLVGTLKVEKRVEQAVWLPDGKHLLLVAEGKGLVIPREQFGEDVPAKAVAEFDLPAGGGHRLGVTPDGSEVYAVATAGQRLNAETRLARWPLKELLAGSAKPRVLTLDADNPTALTFDADGKTALAVVREPRGGAGWVYGQNPYRGSVVRVSGKTGSVRGDPLALEDPDGTLVGAAVHAPTGRAFAHFFTTSDQVRCYDLATGKVKWERGVDSGNQSTSHPPQVSPDGKAVAVVTTRVVQMVLNQGPGQPPRLYPQTSYRPQLLAADTGETVADLGSDDAYASGLGGFSADGKLLFGWLSRNSGYQYLVWDVGTGKQLKTWNRGSGDVTAAFAPTGHELAIVERTSKTVYATNPDGSRVVSRTEHTAVVGLWDLGPLVK